MTLTWPGAPDLPQLPFGRLFRRLERPVPEGTAIVTAYTDGQVTLRSNRAKERYHEAADLSSFQGVEAGDFVVHGLDILRGSVGISDSAGAMSPVVSVCEPVGAVDLRYVAHVIRVQAVTGYTKAMARGIREGGADFRRWGTLAELPIPVPPLEYQRRVCDYLDRETARIDTLIEEQQRLIEMLRERRFALRVNVALHGTAPSAQVESTLPWAQRLPVGWRVVPLTSVARLESGHTPSRSREDWWQDCYIPWVSLHDVGTMRGVKYLERTAQEISEAGMANSSARLLPAHTVVLSRDATVGRTAIMGVPMATSQHFAAWVCGPSLDPEYLWMLFTDAMQPFFDSFQNGSTIRTIGMGDLKAFRIPLPPLDEQRRIVAHLDEETAKIDALIAESERLVELARERRAALITAAVTGQIDVREMA